MPRQGARVLSLAEIKIDENPDEEPLSDLPSQDPD
jgi:hypothetical protein